MKNEYDSFHIVQICLGGGSQRKGRMAFSYQFSIKIIWNEDPFYIEPDIFCFGIDYVILSCGSNGWHIKYGPELHLTLQEQPSPA